MSRNVEHIGIAVKNLAVSNKQFRNLLNQEPYKQEKVVAQQVTTSFFQLGTTKIELLEGAPDSVIAKFIEKRGEGLHHIAFEVENIQEEMKRLKNEGFTILSEEAGKGADNKLVCFIHPKSTNGVLVELCQEIR